MTERKWVMYRQFGLIGIMFGALLLLALTSKPSRGEVPLKQCSEIHLLQTWRGVGPDGTMVRHFHAFVHERYEFVIDMRRAIPVWPDALMCFYPPADSA